MELGTSALSTPPATRRIGVIGVVITDRQAAAGLVNRVLSDFSSIIVGRQGVPYRDRGIAVISLIVDGTSDQLGAMTGRLGAIDGVLVKAALTTYET